MSENQETQETQEEILANFQVSSIAICLLRKNSKPIFRLPLLQKSPSFQ